MLSIFSYRKNDFKTGWRTINGFSLNIKGDADHIEAFYTDLEYRLSGYKEWINIVLTGELNDFQKDYAPFSSNFRTFNYFNSIYTSIDMTELLLRYSHYFENILLNTELNDSNKVEMELNRLYQFAFLLNNYFVNNQNILIENLIDVMKFDPNFYYSPIYKTLTVHIILNEGKFIISQLPEIKDQIILEINSLPVSKDLSTSLVEKKFKITNTPILSLLENYGNYMRPQFSHVYKYLPFIDNSEFNSRMNLMKKNIHRNRVNLPSTPVEFFNALSNVEEQLIEFQTRNDFHNNNIVQLINMLVGDGESGSGILTSLINLSENRNHYFRVIDFLKKSSKYLKNDVAEIIELTYPNIESLPNKILSKYIHNNHAIIIDIN